MKPKCTSFTTDMLAAVVITAPTSSRGQENDSLTCPFCNENDFDKIGLKHHLTNHCEEFEKTPDIVQRPRISLTEDPTGDSDLNYSDADQGL